jgi:hypothetical protein
LPYQQPHLDDFNDLPYQPPIRGDLPSIPHYNHPGGTYRLSPLRLHLHLDFLPRSGAQGFERILHRPLAFATPVVGLNYF